MKFLVTLVLLAVCVDAHACFNGIERRQSRREFRRAGPVTVVQTSTTTATTQTCPTCPVPAKPLTAPDPFTKK